MKDFEASGDDCVDCASDGVDILASRKIFFLFMSMTRHGGVKLWDPPTSIQNLKLLANPPE